MSLDTRTMSSPLLIIRLANVVPQIVETNSSDTGALKGRKEAALHQPLGAVAIAVDAYRINITRHRFAFNARVPTR